MKRGIVSLIVMGYLAGCHQEDVNSKGGLYRRWQLQQIRYNDGRQGEVTGPIGQLIEFKRDGTIVYNNKPGSGACCYPFRYTRQDPLLLLDYSTGQPDLCKYVDIGCFGAYAKGSAWQIITLTDDALSLQTTDALLTHQSYP